MNELLTDIPNEINLQTISAFRKYINASNLYSAVNFSSSPELDSVLGIILHSYNC